MDRRSQEKSKEIQADIRVDMKKRLIFAITLAGFTSMAGQIVLLRELLIIFYGNELSFGVTLAGWLFWVSVGSLGAARWIAGRVKNKTAAFAVCEVALAFILPLSILCARSIPAVLGFHPGEIIGILPMSLSAFTLLGPICILGGFLFALGCEMYKPVREGAARIGYVYILEAAGAATGGLLTSLVLIKFLTPIQIIFFISLLNLTAALFLLREKKIFALPVSIILAGFILLLTTGQARYLRNASLSRQWKGYDLLASENSVYGNVAVTKREDQYSVFTNGLYAFSVPDRSTSEMAAHFPLIEHPGPEHVLLIGGGSSGQLREVLKHPVKSVDYVELDPLVIGLARRHIPPDGALEDPRVNIITEIDGRLFIKRAGRRYDVIIVNLPEPHTAQLNRFYTREFYSEASESLTDNGIISFSSYSNPNYMSPEQVRLYVTLKNTLEEVFPDVKITPGATNYFLASKKKGMLTLDWRVLTERMETRGIEAKYMREYYLFSELSDERIDAFQSRLAEQESWQPELNADFRPVAYYYNMTLWSTYFKYNLKKMFKAINAKVIYTGAIALYLILIIPALLKGVTRKIPSWGVLICVGTTGFAEMAFQVIILLSFQVMYGYVYYKLGIILSSYMLGLIIGAWLVTRSLDNIKEGRALFIKTQVMIFIYPLILPILFRVFSALKGGASFWWGSNVIFPYLPVIPGLIGGYQFPLANRLHLDAVKTGTGQSAGLTYGIDILGACLGAIVVTMFLVPIVGIYMSCLLVAGLNLAGLIVLVAAGGKK